MTALELSRKAVRALRYFLCWSVVCSLDSCWRCCRIDVGGGVGGINDIISSVLESVCSPVSAGDSGVIDRGESGGVGNSVEVEEHKVSGEIDGDGGAREARAGGDGGAKEKFLNIFACVYGG